jgi:hypothetical protein
VYCASPVKTLLSTVNLCSHTGADEDGVELHTLPAMHFTGEITRATTAPEEGSLLFNLLLIPS